MLQAFPPFQFSWLQFNNNVVINPTPSSKIRRFENFQADIFVDIKILNFIPASYKTNKKLKSLFYIKL